MSRLLTPVGRAMFAAILALLLTFLLVFAPLVVSVRTPAQLLGLRAVSVLAWLLFVRTILAPCVQSTPMDLGLGVSLRSIPRLVIGLGVGAAALTAAFCIAWGAGGFVVVPDVAWGGPSQLANDLALFAVAALFEELCFRVGMLATLRTALPPSLAVGVSGAVFGLLHAQNPGATTIAVLNTMLAGVLLGLMFLERRGQPRIPSLALCTGFHFAWNATASFFFGVPVSGFAARTRVLAVEPHDLLWSGGSYGLEAGLGATVVLTALCVWATKSADLRAPTR